MVAEEEDASKNKWNKNGGESFKCQNFLSWLSIFVSCILWTMLGQNGLKLKSEGILWKTERVKNHLSAFLNWIPNLKVCRSETHLNIEIVHRTQTVLISIEYASISNIAGADHLLNISCKCTIEFHGARECSYTWVSHSGYSFNTWL